MSLTKKHFIKIAEIVNQNKDYFTNEQDKFINDLCDYFKTENPEFKENKFKEACLK